MEGSDKMAELQTVSYDQFTDIPSLGGKSKIIFSEKVYKYLDISLYFSDDVIDEGHWQSL